MKRIPITPFLILAALFTVIGASVYMEAEAEKRKQEELQRQQEEYLEKYEKAENAILMQDYNTAVELLENLPENFKDKEYVLVYAKYCKSVADGETIHTQYRITWELPHEGDMYTGDFAEEMKIARETAAKENEAEERRLKKEKEKKEREKIKQDQPYRGMDEKYITSTIWGFYDKKESENYRDSNGQVKVQNTYKWREAMARTEMEQSAGMEKLRTLYDMYRNLLLVIVVLPINIRHAVNPLPTINCHRKKMNMMYMIMMIQRISIMIMKMILTNMEMRRITGMRLNKATSI